MKRALSLVFKGVRFIFQLFTIIFPNISLFKFSPLKINSFTEAQPVSPQSTISYKHYYMQESGLLTKLKYSPEYQPKPQPKKSTPPNPNKTSKHDEFSLLSTLKYGIKPEVNIFPIEVDFPLPSKFVGQENRINSQYNLEIPEHLLKRNKPANLVGSVVRLDYLLANASTYLDKDVTVAGWANSARLQENDTLLFIELVDGTSPVPLQIVVKSTAPNFTQLKKTKRSYSFRIFGRIIKSLGKGQQIQLSISGEPGQYVKILGTCDDDKYPLGGKYFTPEYLREIAHLRPRTYLISSVARIKNSLAYATHLFFQNNGFIYIHTPEITASDCEGAGEMFQVTTILPETGLIADIPQIDGKINYDKEFFKKPAFLTVSGQLAVENYCCALSNVYTFGPTFRAEVSHTSRHAAEFWMIEPEIAFADVYDVIECAEAYIKFCIKFVLENNAEDLKFLQGKPKKGLRQYLEAIISKPFNKASYTQAIDILSKVKEKGVVFENPCEWGDDLASEHEKYLCDHIFNGPTVLYNYPRDIKAFYMRQNTDGLTVASFDVLAPQIGEIVGGSQREERLDKLEKRITDLGLNLESYWWYLELRKFGTVPHGGFGLGFERLIMMCTGVENIRDVLAFPRTPGKAEF